MSRLKATDVHLPLSTFSVIRLHQKSKVSGFFLPNRPDQGPMLIEGDGESLVAITLDGQRSFQRFDLTVGGSLEGILFADIQLAVDVTSRFNPAGQSHLGALTLVENRANLVSFRAGDDFMDREPFPLSIEADAKAEKPFGFRKWSIVAQHEGDEIELWRTEDGDATSKNGDK